MTKDTTELAPEEFHPAARSAYRWLKGYVVNNAEDYRSLRVSLQISADEGNRQAQVCMGTIERLQNGQPVSDRYLLGLAWTILSVHNRGALETVANKRTDRTYDRNDKELPEGFKI